MAQIEDKLTREERLRLECLAQAVALNAMKPPINPQLVVQAAYTFEQYVAGGQR